MTDKEKAYIKAHEDSEDSLEVLALKLFRKELVKNLQKKGYDRKKSDFGVEVSVLGDEYIYFKGENPAETVMFIPDESDYETWKNSDKNALEVYGKSEKKNTILFGGEEWMKRVKSILINYDRHNEPVEEREEM